MIREILIIEHRIEDIYGLEEYGIKVCRGKWEVKVKVRREKLERIQTKTKVGKLVCIIKARENI